ncbi:reverse transcriptase-like protein, partial [Enterobacter cloacae complex sp. 4DZ3-28B]|uniref:reverse transcriptase-like protein n=1 Tax=Enterobacter cloacae complex sp. 4DZ3-28B TaxID=2511989 RepID=UPI0010124EB1
AYQRQQDKAAGGIIILNPQKEVMVRKGITLPSVHSNNEAEYAALTLGLEECKELGIQRLIIKGDSLLVVRQIQGT